LAGALQQPHEQVAGAVAAVRVHHRVEGVQPLERLVGVDVGQLVAESVEHEAHGLQCPTRAPRGATIRAVATTVYTDGAWSGNPGPGGWAWAVPGGAWATGAEPRSTNQRMEITAVLEAVKALGGRLDVVSDSTYVVNCFRDAWWKGWIARGWRNSAGKPVAN